jgi:hypothetical protein
LGGFNEMKKITILITISMVFLLITAVTATSIQYKSVQNNSTYTTPLGNTSYGNVVKVGPYGNKSSNVKIACIVGVHPLESDAHQAMVESITQHDNSLKYCYYVYHVNVTENADNYTTGRMNGQLLANKFVVPDINNQNYQLAIDIHSNVGNWAQNTFLFSPVNNSTSESIGMNITGQLKWLKYYVPPNPTSTVYVTEPIINAGTPAIVYETYHNDTYRTVKNHADEFLLTVDNLSIIG